MRSWTCIIGDRDSWWTKANQQCFSVTIVIKMQSKWYMRSWKSRLRHWKSTKYGTSEFALPVTSVDLGGVRENGEECAYQIACSVEPTLGSPLGPGREFSSTRCTRKDVRRGGTLAWGQEDARERGEGNHLMRRRRLQGHRRRRSCHRKVGGGDQAPPAAALPLRRLAESSERWGHEGRSDGGDFSPMFVGRAWFHGDIRLTRAGNPNVAGFQSHMSGSAWKDSAWAAGPGKWRGSRPGNGLPN